MIKTNLIIALFLYFPFVALSEIRRGDIPPPTSCNITFPHDILFDNINTDDFSTYHAGTLANEYYIQPIPIIINNCSVKNIDVKLSINKQSIDSDSGYFINYVDSPSASKNITFQLLDDDENPINLNQRNNFIKTIDEKNEAEFYFSLNYVKKDNLPPSPGRINTNIIFNIFINDEIIEVEKLINID